MSETYPLFDKYPELKERVKRISFGKFPTPVERLEKLESRINVGSLWVKRDDLDSDKFSGNKIRVMELLLADALNRGCDTLVSMGALGSNQVLSSIVFGAGMGFDIDGIYFEQPLHGYVKRHLLVGARHRVHMTLCKNPNYSPLYAGYRYLRQRLAGRWPYFIPTFGSHPLCVLGYVNAGMELARQVDEGMCPMPDKVYVTLGTGGTYAGIVLAFKLLGLPVEVVGVRITDLLVCNRLVVANLLNRTLSYMRKRNAKVPKIKFRPGDLVFEHDFFGGEYARSTPESEEAAREADEAADLVLDSTYTAKTMAALFKHAAESKLEGKNTLFWHTLNRIDLRPIICDLNDDCLPEDMREYARNCVDNDKIGF